MIKYIIIGVLLFSCTTQKIVEEVVTSSEAYQQNLVQEYQNEETSPLKGEELTHFYGLRFFPIAEKYNVQTEFELEKELKVIEFPTSTERKASYKEYGTAIFSIDNQKFELIIYQSYPVNPKYPQDLFLPFKDLTNGETSYGGGRYIDLELNDIDKNKLKIDFNKAYNPYCAYSGGYSCPVPPQNNFLDIKIEAGVSYKQENYLH